MKKVIVTGANGFIGLELCKLLNEKCIITLAILRNEKSYSKELSELAYVTPIFCNMDEILELVEETECNEVDAFYHLAWSGITGKERENCDEQLKSIKWTIKAIEAADKLGCKKFIGVGTLAEIDAYNYCSLDGATPNLVSCYGTAKIAAHFMSKAIGNNVGIEHLWAYVGNTYGEKDKSSNFINFAYNLLSFLFFIFSLIFFFII